MKRRIIIFTGPSLSHAEASEILRADYRPPVRRVMLQMLFLILRI